LAGGSGRIRGPTGVLLVIEAALYRLQNAVSAQPPTAADSDLPAMRKPASEQRGVDDRRRHARIDRDMSTTRRLGAEDSATRTALLDAAQHLLLEEGYAAVTSRRVAARAGLKPQLVHYYFRTMDDLFLALVRRGAEQNLERQARALAAPKPLRALWEFSSDPVGTRLTVELFALANHRKALRAELAAYAERFRRLQSDALATLLENAGIDPAAFPPEAVMVLVTSVSRVLVMEEALGMTTGHAAMRALVDRCLARVERDAHPAERSGPPG
jgi:AcrR family transcriptional regulator